MSLLGTTQGFLKVKENKIVYELDHGGPATGEGVKYGINSVCVCARKFCVTLIIFNS